MATLEQLEAKRRQRREYSRVRLQRVLTLRRIGAPAYIVKHEQMLMVCNRRGVKGRSKLGVALFERHVAPLMVGVDQAED